MGIEQWEVRQIAANYAVDVWSGLFPYDRGGGEMHDNIRDTEAQGTWGGVQQSAILAEVLQVRFEVHSYDLPVQIVGQGTRHQLLYTNLQGQGEPNHYDYIWDMGSAEHINIAEGPAVIYRGTGLPAGSEKEHRRAGPCELDAKMITANINGSRTTLTEVVK